jgi:hypothetical protein
VTQNEPGGIVTLKAQTHQILVQALGQIELAAESVIARLPIRNQKKLRGRTQLLPQLSCAGIGVARFRRAAKPLTNRNAAPKALRISSSARWRSGSSGSSGSWSSAF